MSSVDPAARQLVQECIDTLNGAVTFLHRILYTHAQSDEAVPETPTIWRSPVASNPPQPKPGSPSQRRDEVLRELILFADELDAKVVALKNKAYAGSPSGATLGEHVSSEMGTVQFGADVDPLAHSLDERKRVSFLARSQVGGWISITGDPGISPSERLTPIQRSVSMAFGGTRRRRSTFYFLSGMPALSLDDGNGQHPARISRKTKRHTNVFRPEADFKAHLRELQVPLIPFIQTAEFDSITLDTPAFCRKLNGLPVLTVVVLNIFVQYSFCTSLRIDIDKLINFLNTVASCYRIDNPYHNQLHAANTLQMVHLYARQPSSGMEHFDDWEILSLFIAALTTSVGHLGVTDAFLELTRHPLRAIYPDGTQRSMSLALALAILSMDSCNFLALAFDARHGASLTSSPPDPHTYESFVLLVSQLVLHSDENLHQELMNQLQWIKDKGFVDNDHVLFVLAAVLRLAASAHLLKPRAMFFEWIARFTAENFRQGAAHLGHYLEACGARELSEPLVKVADDADIPPNQYPGGIRCVDFFHNMAQYVMLPLVEFPRNVFPPAWIDQAKENVEALVGEDPEKELLQRTRELFDYVAAFANPVDAPAWSDVPQDALGFFTLVVLPSRNIADPRGGSLVRRGKLAGSITNARGSSRELLATQQQVPRAASVSALRVVNDLLRFVERRITTAARRPSLDNVDGTADLCQEWLTLLQRGNDSQCTAAFLSGSSAAAKAPLPARAYLNDSLSPSYPPPTVLPVDALSICRSLIPPAADAQFARGDLSGVAASVAGHLTRIWLALCSRPPQPNPPKGSAPAVACPRPMSRMSESEPAHPKHAQQRVLSEPTCIAAFAKRRSALR